MQEYWEISIWGNHLLISGRVERDQLPPKQARFVTGDLGRT